MHKSILISLLAIGLFSGCSDVEFAQVSTEASLSVDPESRIAQESFTSYVSKRPIDVIWTIDNSGSMNEEAAHVRNNFLAFMNTVQARADVRVALISRTGQTGTAVTMPSELANNGHVQIDYIVASRNPTLVAAAASCPSAPNNHCDSLPLMFDAYAPLRGSLDGFFRDHSKKVFVFVTDDDSRPMTEVQFLTHFNAIFPESPPTVYTFGAIDQTQSPCLASPSNVYKSLSASTGGEFFNICAPDWSQHFSRLAESVTNLAQNKFWLDRPAVEILEVVVGSTQLGPHEYQIVGGREVVIDASALSGQTQQSVRIVYQY